MIKRYLKFMHIDPAELSLESFKREVDWTWPLFLSAFVLGLAVFRMPA